MATTIIGAISAKHVACCLQRKPPLAPTAPGNLSGVSFVTVERAGVCEKAFLQQDPLHPKAIRRCLLETARDAEERSEVERLHIAPGLTTFRVGDMHVRTRRAMMTKDPVVDTWCSWVEGGAFRFWTSPPTIDLSDFVVAALGAEGDDAEGAVVHYEASVLPSEQGTWTKGVIDRGGGAPKMAFYRISRR